MHGPKAWGLLLPSTLHPPPSTLHRLPAIQELLDYAQTDLVCYRAGNIPQLYKEQAEKLNPLLAWAHHRFAVSLEITDGCMPLPASADNSARLAQALEQYNAWQMAALSVATKALGSLVLGLALVEGQINAEEAFILSTLEEAYETKMWGEDTEKEQKLSTLREEVKAVGHFLSLLSSSP